MNLQKSISGFFSLGARNMNKCLRIKFWSLAWQIPDHLDMLLLPTLLLMRWNLHLTPPSQNRALLGASRLNLAHLVAVCILVSACPSSSHLFETSLHAIMTPSLFPQWLVSWYSPIIPAEGNGLPGLKEILQLFCLLHINRQWITSYIRCCVPRR